MQIPPSEKTELIISGKSGHDWNILHEHRGMIHALTPTESMIFTHEPEKAFGASSLFGDLKFTIPLSEVFVLAKKRVSKKSSKKPKNS